MVARHYTVRGRVQGVGFRYFAYGVARDLDLKGWVRNLPNGDVEIHAEGEEGKMRQFLDCIRSGPPMSFVEHINVQEVDAKSYSDFSIRF